MLTDRMFQKKNKTAKLSKTEFNNNIKFLHKK